MRPGRGDLGCLTWAGQPGLSELVRSCVARLALTPPIARQIRGTEIDSWVIGLLVNANDCQNLVDAWFDGVFTYFVSKRFTFGSNPRNWKLAKDCSGRLQTDAKLFIPSVGPG